MAYRSCGGRYGVPVSHSGGGGELGSGGVMGPNGIGGWLGMSSRTSQQLPNGQLVARLPPATYPGGQHMALRPPPPSACPATTLPLSSTVHGARRGGAFGSLSCIGAHPPTRPRVNRAAKMRIENVPPRSSWCAVGQGRSDSVDTCRLVTSGAATDHEDTERPAGTTS